MMFRYYTGNGFVVPPLLVNPSDTGIFFVNTAQKRKTASANVIKIRRFKGWIRGIRPLTHSYCPGKRLDKVESLNLL